MLSNTTRAASRLTHRRILDLEAKIRTLENKITEAEASNNSIAKAMLNFGEIYKAKASFSDTAMAAATAATEATRDATKAAREASTLRFKASMIGTAATLVTGYLLLKDKEQTRVIDELKENYDDLVSDLREERRLRNKAQERKNLAQARANTLEAERDVLADAMDSSVILSKLFGSSASLLASTRLAQAKKEEADEISYLEQRHTQPKK